MKAHLENDKQLSARGAALLCFHLTKLTHWKAMLHILQCLLHLHIGNGEKTDAETFIRDCLLSKNKFVRAWAYGGFLKLPNQYSEFSKEFERLFESTLENEAPSVKARLRNLSKEETKRE